MTNDEIALLKYVASTENVSVEYYDGGKSYTMPIAEFLLDNQPYPLDELDSSTMVYIDCSYIMPLGTPMIKCEITYGEAGILLEEALIPLDVKKRTPHQRNIMSLVNLCSKRVIAQEMSRTKYAIAMAAKTLNANKQYS